MRPAPYLVAGTAGVPLSACLRISLHPENAAPRARRTRHTPQLVSVPLDVVQRVQHNGGIAADVPLTLRPELAPSILLGGHGCSSAGPSSACASERRSGAAVAAGRTAVALDPAWADLVLAHHARLDVRVQRQGQQGLRRGRLARARVSCHHHERHGSNSAQTVSETRPTATSRGGLQRSTSELRARARLRRSNCEVRRACVARAHASRGVGRGVRHSRGGSRLGSNRHADLFDRTTCTPPHCVRVRRVG